MKKIVITLLLVAAVLGISSCDLIGSLFDPDYVGTWELEQTTEFMTSRITLVLEKEAFEMFNEVKDDGIWYDAIAYKGTMVVEEDSLTLTLTHLKSAENQGDSFPDEWTALTDEQIETLGDAIWTWVIEGDELIVTDDKGERVFTAVD